MHEMGERKIQRYCITRHVCNGVVNQPCPEYVSLYTRRRSETTRLPGDRCVFIEDNFYPR